MRGSSFFLFGYILQLFAYFYENFCVEKKFSDIIQTFHVHINKMCCQFDKVFFQVSLGEMFG